MTASDHANHQPCHQIRTCIISLKCISVISPKGLVTLKLVVLVYLMACSLFFIVNYYWFDHAESYLILEDFIL